MDTEILNEIEDFLVNNYGEDERPLSAEDANEMLAHIADTILEKRRNE